MTYVPAPGSVREILTDGHPVLATPSAEVDGEDAGLATDLADLTATLADFRARAGFGRAISAPQIGIAKRIILAELGDGPRAIINPVVTWSDDAVQWVWDDCLSVPDRLVRLPRASSITMEFSDHAGARWRWRALPADLAELFQHEIDHLDGILMTDRAGPQAETVPLSARAEVAGQSPARTAPDAIVTELLQPGPDPVG
ncbi:MAG: peptide deformylase [Actinomycetota bacterium]